MPRSRAQSPTPSSISTTSRLTAVDGQTSPGGHGKRGILHRLRRHKHHKDDAHNNRLRNAPTSNSNRSLGIIPFRSNRSEAPTTGTGTGTPQMVGGFDQSDFNSLPDLNTAGDAIMMEEAAGLGDGVTPGVGELVVDVGGDKKEEEEEEGIGMHYMEESDSAFGEAFHGVHNQGGIGGGGADTPAGDNGM
ncbi:hypothetical protein GGR56DRAFT_688627 [Xylariaceae sp. FL0804]|nr:hypothetical protein GGR56DRAFT_688627 [Xylariaceae sp. FL0804]